MLMPEERCGRLHVVFARTMAVRLAVWLFTAHQLSAQSTTTSPDKSFPAFEVATVKLNTSNTPRNFWLDPGGRLTITSFTLRDLIRVSYGSDETKLQTTDQFIGGPSWLGVDRFDIAAKTGGDVYPGQPGGSARLLGMLRKLVTERFHLVVHSDVREMRIYRLALANKGGTLGPQLHHSTIDCPAPKPDEAPAPPDPVRWCGFRGVGSGVLTGQGVTVVQMATIFSGYPEVRRPVIDRTGLTGTFDLRLESAPGDTSQTGTSDFTAMREQLGLKLESTKGFVEVLVIDHAERPHED
jgi:uncharacterized protein (TIGR03435 family)